MKTQKAFLLINGETPKTIPDLTNYDLICATDGAFDFLKAQNITPDFISGDFDSVSSLPTNTEVIHTPDQNFTDFDKALQIIKDRNITQVDVYGASGKEQDHFLGNLHTALQWKSKLQLTFYDNYGTYFLANNTNKLNNCNGKTISLIPFPNATKITTSGLQFPLHNEDLILGNRIGTRNLAIQDEISVTFDTGDLFIFINHK